MKKRTHWIDRQSRTLVERKRKLSYPSYELTERLSIFKISSDTKRVIITTKLKTLLFRDFETLTHRGLSCDFMAYIVNIIFQRKFLYKNSIQNGARLCITRLTEINHRARVHLDYLLENNIICVSQDYSSSSLNKKCRTYSLLMDIESYAEYQLSEAVILSKIKSETDIEPCVDNDLIKLNYESNVDFIRKLVLEDKWKDEKTLHQKCKEIVNNNFWAYYTKNIMSKISNAKSTNEAKQVLGFAYSDKHNRLYDNFKSIPKNLKPCFCYSYKGELIRLADLDVPNSHPLFLVLLLSEFYYNYLRRSVRTNKKTFIKHRKYGVDNIKANKVYYKINKKKIGNNKWIRKIIMLGDIRYPYVKVEIDLPSLKNELISLISLSFGGCFYEQFYSNKNCTFSDVKFSFETRDEVKKPVMYFLNDKIFSRNSLKFRKALNERYPNFTKLYLIIRLQDKKYQELGYLLAKSESEIRLGVMEKCKKKSPRKIPVFDMHDGFLTPNIGENLEFIQTTFLRLILSDKRKKILACLKNEWKFVKNLPPLRLIDKSDNFR